SSSHIRGRRGSRSSSITATCGGSTPAMKATARFPTTSARLAPSAHSRRRKPAHSSAGLQACLGTAEPIPASLSHLWARSSEMSILFTRRPVFLAAFLAASLARAVAQDVATTVEQLRQLVKAGDRVTVIDNSGEVVKGRVIDLSPTTLNLQTNRL